VTKSNLPKEFQLLWLWHVHCPCYTEKSLDDVSGSIALATERHDDVNTVLALTIHRAETQRTKTWMRERKREREREGERDREGERERPNLWRTDLILRG
jgi:hypothetical protein